MSSQSVFSKKLDQKISPGLRRDEITSDHEKTEPFNSGSTFMEDCDLQTWRSKINAAIEERKTLLMEPFGIIIKEPLRIHKEHKRCQKTKDRQRLPNQKPKKTPKNQDSVTGAGKIAPLKIIHFMQRFFMFFIYFLAFSTSHCFMY